MAMTAIEAALASACLTPAGLTPASRLASPLHDCVQQRPSLVNHADIFIAHYF